MFKFRRGVKDLLVSFGVIRWIVREFKEEKPSNRMTQCFYFLVCSPSRTFSCLPGARWPLLCDSSLY